MDPDLVKPFISDKVKLNHIASNTGNSISVPFTMLKITSGDDMLCITFVGVGSFTSNIVPGEYFLSQKKQDHIRLPRFLRI